MVNPCQKFTDGLILVSVDCQLGVSQPLEANISGLLVVMFNKSGRLQQHISTFYMNLSDVRSF